MKNDLKERLDHRFIYTEFLNDLFPLLQNLSYNLNEMTILQIIGKVIILMKQGFSESNE